VKELLTALSQVRLSSVKFRHIDPDGTKQDFNKRTKIARLVKHKPYNLDVAMRWALPPYSFMGGDARGRQ
jgi:hypothetical protein